jgi:serine phosphatase RsbU (regulator of sigma subunit)
VVPCGELGGDVFDVVRGADGSVTAFVVDVSGHGLGAALVAAGVRGILRLLLASHGLVDAATVLNDQLVESGSDHYACVAIVRLTGSELEIVNAGLPPVCILEGGQVVASVSGAGTPPGLFPGAAYTSARRTVTPSARIVVMSDGLTEPFGRADDVPAGIARLALGSGDGSSPGELAARIGGALSAQEMVDDATVVMLEGTVCGAGAPYARHAS